MLRLLPLVILTFLAACSCSTYADNRAIPPDGNTYCIVRGDTVLFVADSAGDGTGLMVDHRFTKPTVTSVGASQDLVSWLASRPGMHFLQTVNASFDGTLSLVHAYHVRVLDDAPFIISGIPATTTQNAHLRIVNAPESGFKAVSISVVDQSGNTTTISPLSSDALLPLETAPSGLYSYTITAKDASGAIYVGPSFTVQVPTRIAVTSPSDYILSHSGDRLQLSISYASDIKISKVEYTVDGSLELSSSSSPFSGDCDMSNFHTGSHTVVATLTDSDGNHFTSKPYEVNYTNQIEDTEMAAQQAANAKTLEDAQASAAAQKAKEQAELKNNGDYAVANKQVNLSMNSIQKSGDTAQIAPHWDAWIDIQNNSAKDIGVMTVGTLVFDDYSNVGLLDSTEDPGQIYIIVPSGAHTRISYEGDDTDIANHSKRPVNMTVTVGSTDVKIPVSGY